MSLDFSRVMLAVDGREMQSIVNSQTMVTVPFTYRIAAVDALCDERVAPCPPERKIVLFALAVKIQNAAEPLELSIDELKLLKDRALVHSSIIVAARMSEFLEGK